MMLLREFRHRAEAGAKWENLFAQNLFDIRTLNSE